MDRAVLEQAIALNFSDFEDAVQYACAAAYKVDAIVTRDQAGLVDVAIAVILPSQVGVISRG